MPRIHSKKDASFLSLAKPGKNGEVKTASSPFSNLLAEVEQQELKKRLDFLLESIDERANALKKRLTQENLQAYKIIIGEFLKVVNKEYIKTKETMTRGRDGRLRILRIIDHINTEMEELKMMVLSRDISLMKIVERLDGIRGLLLDIYT